MAYCWRSECDLRERNRYTDRHYPPFESSAGGSDDFQMSYEPAVTFPQLVLKSPQSHVRRLADSQAENANTCTLKSNKPFMLCRKPPRTGVYNILF